MRIATSENCSVSLADLWHRHTVTDLLDYVEMLDWYDDTAQISALEAEAG